MEYKLSTALFGHSMDVRALATTSDGNIISASRDRTAKIWKPNGFNSGYTDVQTLKGHSNFVSSVCVLPATEAYPGGIVLTGSNDNTICVFSPDNPQPLFTLKGHNSTVCHLSPGINPGTFLSASWDFTCKIWSLSTPSEPQATLTGHQMAVWSCLQLLSSFIITASADKTIIVYTSDGKSHKTLSGHTDCVRDLTAVSETEFLSCSNDATIRKWNALTGESLDIMYGHPNYIYSISALNNVIASGGEDRIVKVWQGGKHQQLILPSQSIWAVAVLPNMDVVTGSSDGVVRIFSANPERYADETTLAQFNEEVSNLNAAAQQEIGGVKVSDLPGIEALYEPGKSDGQTKLIREGGGVVCYNWSAANQKWEKVGDVMGAGNENPQESTGGPQMYEGKPYDYVFSVDIEDGKPPLKLPYNDGEDPWHAAQNFIHRHNLSQQFLEQVANFIITNSRKPETSAPAGSTQQQFCDPFTGGARYIPTGSDAPALNSNVTNGNAKPELQHPTAAEVKLFPQTSYLRFDHGNLKLILEKLEEFNKKSASGVDVDKLKSLIELADVSSQPSAEALTTLKQLLHWAPDILFPVLDVLRLAIRNSEVNASLCDGPSGEQMLQMLQQHLDPSALPANQMLATRALSNMLTHPTGESLLLKNREFLLDTFSMLLNNSNTPNKQLQIALTTVLLNLSIVFINNNDKPSQESTMILLNKALPVCVDPEAQLRGLVTLGTLLVSSNNLINLVDPLVVDLLHQLAFQENSNNSNSNKVIACSKQILQLLKE